MSLFENLLEIKCWKRDLQIKAIYIPNSVYWWKGTYFIYYYDMKNHIIYIDDVTEHLCQYRTSLINIMERVVTKIYLHEVNKCWISKKKTLQKKSPEIIYFYRQKNTRLIILDTVVLQSVKNIKWIIKRFKNPSWTNDGWCKLRYDELDDLKKI